MIVQGKDGRFRQVADGTMPVSPDEQAFNREFGKSSGIFDYASDTTIPQWRTISEMTKSHGPTSKVKFMLDFMYVKFSDGTEGFVRRRDGMFVEEVS